LVFLLFLTSCSSDDTDNSFLNPPSWLIGTWEINSETDGITEFVFTRNNITHEKQNGLTLDYTEHYTNDFGSTIEELTISNSEYSYKLTGFSGGLKSTATITLVKISDTEFERTAVGSHSSTENTVFIKQ
jgi:hypothetical protein